LGIWWLLGWALGLREAKLGEKVVGPLKCILGEREERPRERERGTGEMGKAGRDEEFSRKCRREKTRMEDDSLVLGVIAKVTNPSTRFLSGVEMILFSNF